MSNKLHSFHRGRIISARTERNNLYEALILPSDSPAVVSSHESAIFDHYINILGLRNRHHSSLQISLGEFSIPTL